MIKATSFARCATANEAMNALQIIRNRQVQKVRRQAALRAQWINANEVCG